MFTLSGMRRVDPERRRVKCRTDTMRVTERLSGDGLGSQTDKENMLWWKERAVPRGVRAAPDARAN